MAVYYFETDPILEDVYFDDSFLILVKHPTSKKNGKTQEIKDYNARAIGQQKSLEALKAGHVNLHNRPIVLSNIFSDFAWWENFDAHYIYQCKPTSAKKPRSYYNNYFDPVETYEFDVVRTFESKDDLVSLLIENNQYAELIAKLISTYSYRNDGYSDDYRTSIAYVADIASKTRTKAERWKDNIYWVSDNISGSGPMVDANLLWTIQNEYVSVDTKYLSNDTIKNLCKRKLYNSMLECVKILGSTSGESLSRDVKRYLAEASDVPAVKEVVRILGLETPKIVLTVVKTGSYSSDVELESIEHKTMDDVKTYIVKNYDVSFADLSGSVENVRVSLDDEHCIEFRTAVQG